MNERNIMAAIIAAGYASSRPYVPPKEAAEHAAEVVEKLMGPRAEEDGPRVEGDGWVEHIPGDRRPCGSGDHVRVMFRCREERDGVGAGFNWTSHDDNGMNPDYAIIAWKPANL